MVILETSALIKKGMISEGKTPTELLSRSLRALCESGSEIELPDWLKNSKKIAIVEMLLALIII